MKLKLTVLTLLVVGLAFGFSSVAFGQAAGVITLMETDNTTYTVDSPAAADVAGVPALKFQINNTGDVTETITEIVVENGTGSLTLTAADFTLNAYDDADSNGVLNQGDTQLNTALLADVEITAAVAGKTTIELDVGSEIVLAPGETAYVIVTVTYAVAAGVDGDAVELVLDMADALTGYTALALAASADTDLDPTDEANVPLIAVDDGAGTVTPANHAAAVLNKMPEEGKMPNKAEEHVIAGFKLTADADVSHVVEVIALDHAFTGAADEDDFSVIKIYIDVDNSGTVSTNDIELAVDEVLDAAVDTYALDFPLFLAAGSANAKNLIVTVEGLGTALSGETLASTLTDATSVIDGGNTVEAGTQGGDIQTIVALDVTMSTVDVTGPPYGRPNGYLDAIKLAFDIDGTAADVDDDLFEFTIAPDPKAAEWVVTGHNDSYSATYNSDVADNSYVYIVIDEAGGSDTADTPNVAYTQGVTLITDDTGEYALATFSTGPDDKAPPAPLSVTTGDDGNGMIEEIVVEFSETVTAGDEVGFSFTGLVITGASGIPGVALTLDVEEVEGEFNTGAAPPYTYTSTSGLHQDVENNQVLSFNSLSIPVIDGAAPTLVKATTGDTEPDGMFDHLTLLFSEEVMLNADVADITVDDLADNTGNDGFNFGAAHNGVYNFAGTGHTLTGDTIVLKVNEVGSLDTAVKPSLLFNSTALAELLTDKAPTPNVLAVANEFVMVFDADDVVAADDVLLVDDISPQIVSAVTLDGELGDLDGKLDAIQMTFSEAMGADIATYEDLVIEGIEIEEDAAVVDGVDVLVGLVEDDYNTGLEPTITYSGDTIEDASGAKLVSLDAVAIDNAVPLVVSAVTKDMGYGGQTADNGKIDGMAIMFSEDMDLDALDDQFDNDGGDDGIDKEFLVAGYVVKDTVEVVDAANMIIYLTEIAGLTLDTEIKPELGYIAIADSNLADIAGFALATINNADVDETDGAAPVVILATTVDDDNDGFIDGVAITFNETPEIDEDDTTMVLEAVTLEEIEDGNVIDLTMAELSQDGDTITLVGMSSEVAENWDTDALPEVDIAAANGITDAAGNVVAAVAEIATEDGAIPVIGKAIAQKDTKNIVVTFSEPVTNDAVGDLEAADFAYINVADDEVDVNGIDAVTGTAPIAVVTLTTDLTLSEDMVSMDKIAVLEGEVVDLALNKAFVDTVNISDVEIPTLVEAITMDVNNNGQIDTIMLTFTEEIRDENLSGWTEDNDELVVVPMTGPSKWTVEGYQVIGVNKTRTEDNAEDATDDLGEDIFNVGDTPNDEVLYLALVENPPHEFTGPGDTAAAPLLTMVGGGEGGPFASGVSDYTPNYVASITDFQVDDAVGPVIISAEMPDQTTLEVTFSEEPQDDPKAAGVFLWAVGTEEVDYATDKGWILNVMKVDLNPKVLVFVMQKGTNVPAGLESTIEYFAADQLEDMEGNGNKLSEDPVDVTPPPEETTAVEDLPDAFALSKNFPNPFNPTTTIEYAIPADGAGHVDLVIYNIHGQKVRTLVSETKEAGYYNVVWDGRNDVGETVSSGLYLFRIVSGSFTKTERMTFMK
ncbi:FlgD immunoglobulin-like domain containing protein [Candidatus Latescibacterota bacterium]